MADDEDDDGPDTGELKQLLPTWSGIQAALRRIFTGKRIRFALGMTLLGWAVALILEGTYSVSLGAAVFLAGVMIDELRTMPAGGSRTVGIGEIAVSERLFHISFLGFLTLFTGLLADIRILFSVLPLLLLFVLYMGRLLPTGWPYRRLKQVPGVDNVMMAFGAAFFVLTSVLFYNQSQSGLGMLLLMFILAARFFIGFTLPNIGAEKEREGLFAEQGPPRNLPERIGSPSTKKLLLGLNVATVVLLGAMVLFDALHMLAAFPLLAYVFSVLFLYLASLNNAGRMARYYAFTDTYGFFLLTALGWVAFRYSGA